MPPDKLTSWEREYRDWIDSALRGMTAHPPLHDRHAMWRAIDEANERMERESWEATLREIRELDEVSR